MNGQREKWNDFYKGTTSIKKDNWLEKYNCYFTQDKNILDLGCGNGSNLDYLVSKSKKIFACDYSITAIETIRKHYKIIACVADMREKLPYNDSFFDIIIADLSLHYFRESKTIDIINELKRILKRPGYVFARLNSINDVKHGAKQGIEVERNYYNINENYKRFFDKDMILQFFENKFLILNVKEEKTAKYRDEKVLWEIVLQTSV